MVRDQWSVKDKLRYEFCSRMPMAAITYFLIGFVFYFSDFVHDPRLETIFKVLSLMLIAVSIPRALIAFRILKIEADLKSFTTQYRYIFALSFLTFVLVGLLLSVSLLEPQLQDSTVFSCMIIITGVIGAAIFSISLEPFLFKTIIFFAAILPALVVIGSGIHMDTTIRMLGVILVIYITYVITTAQQFYKNSIYRYETENKLSSEKANLKLALEQIQKAQDEVLLQKAKAEQSARMASLGQMAGGVAHEINSPLAIISLSAEIIQIALEKKLMADEDVHSHVTRIQSTVERISKIIRNLLLFSREGGQDPFQKFSINDLIDRTLTLCREKFRSAGIQLIYKPESELYVNGREVQFSQVLLNLLNNAFDACVHEEQPWIQIAIKDLGAIVEIAVSNNGPIIPQSIRSKLFEPFFTTKDIGQGTGLGLSLSRGIVEEHGGQLELDLKSSHTRFYFQVPKFPGI